MVLRGVSLLASSGDRGADSDIECDEPLLPYWPVASPYVTAVGGTELTAVQYNLNNCPPLCSVLGVACVSGGIKVAAFMNASGYLSGGGFSSLIPRPAYQQRTVDAYLNSSSVSFPPASAFNRSGAACQPLGPRRARRVRIGWNAATLCNNTLDACETSPITAAPQWYPFGGTSQSSPIFAGVVSLLLARLRPPFRSAQPAAVPDGGGGARRLPRRYAGDNKRPGCDVGQGGGYEASAGWDAVTGLGTPNFPAMLRYVDKLGRRTASAREHELRQSEALAAARKAAVVTSD